MTAPELIAQGPNLRTIETVITAIQTKEGAGFSIRRPFPTGYLSHIDPFLLLDHMEPTQYAPGQAQGAPDHPHRGFETVTYLLEGSAVHKDSAGNSGTLNAGDVQWMTAGAGVVHSEMPSDSVLKNGGKLHGFQLWVNLPAKDKMIKPRYQDIPSARIPIAQSADGLVKVKVIAGQALGQTAVIDTQTPIIYLHIFIKPGGSIVQSVPKEFNAFAYVIAGQAKFAGSKIVLPDQLARFKNDGGAVEILAQGSEELSVLLIAGQPLNEPIARYGPFVMNTKEEIMQAFDDYQSGRMGQIAI